MKTVTFFGYFFFSSLLSLSRSFSRNHTVSTPIHHFELVERLFNILFRIIFLGENAVFSEIGVALPKIRNGGPPLRIRKIDTRQNCVGIFPFFHRLPRFFFDFLLFFLILFIDIKWRIRYVGYVDISRCPIFFFLFGENRFF